LSHPDAERIFLDNLGLIDQVVRFIAQRHRLSPDERDELQAGVRLKLIEDDYAVIRKFGGRSSLRTYLTVVVQRHFLDNRIQRWGRWRPSVQAQRAGPLAILLDRLLMHDKLTFDEALEVLRTKHGVTESREVLERLREMLPERQPRRFVSDDQLADIAKDADVEAGLINEIDHGTQAAEIDRALSAALAHCQPGERLLLKLRFQDGFQVSRIADLLDVEAKPLYRRLEQIMASVRRELEARGIDKAAIADLLANPGAKTPGSAVSLFEENTAPSVRREGAQHV
jgi:RNA polymerase sigma factor for flagellar operon FliA